MTTRALTFSEMVSLPGMLGILVSRSLAEGREFLTATTRYVAWFDTARLAIAESGVDHADAFDELCRLLDAAE